MRLVSFRPRSDPAAAPRAGKLTDAGVVALDGVASVLELLRGGEEALEQARATRTDPVALADVVLAAPLPRPNSLRDFMLVEEHVRGSFGDVPAAWYDIPVYWKGNPDTVIGPEATVPWPYYTDQLDFELEMGAVIGRTVTKVSVEEARQAIAGYTIFNDWSARDIQFRELSVMIGPGLSKDFATSMGPTLVTRDAIDIDRAEMTAKVNGETWSTGTLGQMRFSFAEVISHLSQEQTLHPGDVLGSGTVARGCGLELDRWIRPDDVVEMAVEGIGVLRNTVGEKHAPPPDGSGIPSVLRTQPH